MNILAIETSCDETSVAILRDGRYILANIVASQIDLHKKYGGVVPELASRQHIVTLVPVLEEAFRISGLDWDSIDAIAVTCGPGLAGALLVGLNAAKALAFARNKPLLAVNHIEAHIYSNWVAPEGTTPPDRSRRRTAGTQRRTTPDLEEVAPTDPQFPLLCLVVSGGHTELVWMDGHGQYRPLGRTVDDAAGEAFDKVARILGLGYPGGPSIQRAAERGNPDAFDFPRKVMRGSFDFSFSGLKTAVLQRVQEFAPVDAPPRQHDAEEAALAEQEGAGSREPGAGEKREFTIEDFDAPVAPPKRETPAPKPAPVAAAPEDAEDAAEAAEHAATRGEFGANPDRSGLIRLQRNQPVTVEPAAPSPSTRPTPAAPAVETRGETPPPRVLGRDEMVPVSTDAPPPAFLARRSGATPPPAAPPAPQPAPDPELPAFLKRRLARGTQPSAAETPAVETSPEPAPAPPPAPRQRAPRAQSSTPTERPPAPRPVMPTEEPAPRPLRPRPVVPDVEDEPPVEPAPRQQSAPPPAPRRAPTSSGPRPLDREIRAVPKGTPPSRSNSDAEDFDSVPDDASDHGDDTPPPPHRGSVALDGPRRSGASSRVPGQRETNKPPLPVADVAASFQMAAVEILVDKVMQAATAYGARTVLVAGGVAANRLLRARLKERLGADAEVRYPASALCTDNAAMVAAAAYFRYNTALQTDWSLDIDPNARYVDE